MRAYIESWIVELEKYCCQKHSQTAPLVAIRGGHIPRLPMSDRSTSNNRIPRPCSSSKSRFTAFEHSRNDFSRYLSGQYPHPARLNMPPIEKGELVSLHYWFEPSGTDTFSKKLFRTHCVGSLVWTEGEFRKYVVYSHKVYLSLFNKQSQQNSPHST